MQSRGVGLLCCDRSVGVRNGQCQLQPAGSHLAQQLCLLLFVACPFDRPSAGERAEQGCSGQGPAHFANDHDEIDIGHSEAAEAFGNDDARPSQFDDLRPKLIVSGLLHGRARHQQFRKAGFLGKEVPCHVPQSLVFLAEREIHARILLILSSLL